MENYGELCKSTIWLIYHGLLSLVNISEFSQAELIDQNQLLGIQASCLDPRKKNQQCFYLLSCQHQPKCGRSLISCTQRDSERSFLLFCISKFEWNWRLGNASSCLGPHTVHQDVPRALTLSPGLALPC